MSDQDAVEEIRKAEHTLAENEQAWEDMRAYNTRLEERAHEAERALAEMREALEKIAEQHPNTLAMIEANGFVFDDIGREPGNWKHLAFSIYTDLCEVDTLASAALRPSEEASDES